MSYRAEKYPQDESPILVDKCDTLRNDGSECSNKATIGVCYFGGYGHKCVRLFCEECYNKPCDRLSSHQRLGLASNRPLVHRVMDGEYLERYTEDYPPPWD